MLKKAVYCFIAFLILMSCARRARPEGGPKDLDKPIMVKATPSFKSIQFNEDEIKIYFDEFIKLKDINSQLIISPPLKYPPVISPLGNPSKFIKIVLQDTLEANTTYTVNFGQAVIDNTEGNILENFKYIFSTGDYIDSLEVKGTIKHAFDLKLDEKQRPTIMLYEVDDSYKDSVIYQQKPVYVGAMLDSVNWNITNIKAGKYLLLALNDLNKNYKFEPNADEIGFYSEFIEVPRDTATIHEMVLFKEILDFDLPSKPQEVSKGHIVFGYEGDPTGMTINTIGELSSDFKYETAFDKKKDTLHYFFKNHQVDSLMFTVSYRDQLLDTLKVKLREDEMDSLYLDKRELSNTLHLRDTIKLITNNPIKKIDTSRIYFIDQDSAKVSFNTSISAYKNELYVHFEKKHDENYVMDFYPGAITDFFEVVNDSLSLNFKTNRPANYSSLFLTLNQVKSYPIIVELLNNRGDVVAREHAKSPKELKFENINADRYMVRIIFDDNGNGKWDTGSYLKKIQPEEVYYFPNVIDARPNWEVIENFTFQP